MPYCVFSNEKRDCLCTSIKNLMTRRDAEFKIDGAEIEF